MEDQRHAKNAVSAIGLCGSTEKIRALKSRSKLAYHNYESEW